MGRAPWLEEFASRWATRWVESQLPSWLGAALRQTSIGFELRSMRFMLHRASVDDTSMTCCSCTPARPCLCEALTPRIAARCTTVTISLAQMDPVVHSASFATCVISLCDYQSCVHSTMFLVPNACNQLKGRTKGKGKGGGKILFTLNLRYRGFFFSQNRVEKPWPAQQTRRSDCEETAEQSGDGGC